MAALTGRKATVHQIVGTASASAYTKMTWNTTAKTASVGSNFWLNSDEYPVLLRLNGVVSVTKNWIVPTGSNSVQVKGFTVNLAGTQTTVASATVASLAVATAPGRIVYSIIYTSGGVSAVAGTSGTATATRGSVGGPGFVATNAVLLGYVTRASSGAASITTAEITLTSFDGTEWTNSPGPFELRPMKGRADFDEMPASIHTGTLPPNIYWQGYNWSAFSRIGEIVDWKVSDANNREETTTQNSGADTSDTGRIGYSLSWSQYIPEAAALDFAVKQDIIVKLYPDRTSTSTYWACQAGLGHDMDLPQADKQKDSVTAAVSGYIEKFTS